MYSPPYGKIILTTIRRLRVYRTGACVGLTLAALALAVWMPGTANAEDPFIPPFVRALTEYFSTGQITETEWTTAIQYMMREDIIRLGEPDFSNPELVAGAVTRNVDGNTIEIDGVRIRIPLVDVEDSGNPAMPHAVLARLLCPVGSPAQYDIDDLQVRDRYGRTIATVYCSTGLSLGEIMIEFGLGWINEWYCDKSEFGQDSWAQGACGP